MATREIKMYGDMQGGGPGDRGLFSSNLIFPRYIRISLRAQFRKVDDSRGDAQHK